VKEAEIQIGNKITPLPAQKDEPEPVVEQRSKDDPESRLTLTAADSQQIGGTSTYPKIPKEQAEKQSFGTRSGEHLYHNFVTGEIAKEVAEKSGFTFYQGPASCIIDTHGADVSIYVPSLRY
jgi:hypothetical protein